jgi:DNA-directed RNA polymerase specialized sigma24 family protein
MTREEQVNSGLSNNSTAGFARDYATEADFCQLFREQMNRFYFLSLMLTADADKAEQCFVTSLGTCTQSRRIFKDWAQRWATHTIIKTAIQIMSPVQIQQQDARSRSEHDEVSSEPEVVLSALQSFPPLDRFVYHMTLVERYSDLECSTFMGCTPQEVRLSRERAVQRLTTDESLSRIVNEFDVITAKGLISSLVERTSQIRH